MRQVFPDSETVAQRLAAHGGITSGFDYLRLFLAFSVFVFHTIVVTVGTSAHIWGGPYRALVGWYLPMFFALSGFLVSSSLHRLGTIRIFLIYRALRIFPALILVVALSAMVLGPLVTSLPLTEYFRHRLFFSYFLNVFGYEQYYLPGVFESTPRSGIVNQPIWTVRYELLSYLLLTCLYFSLAIRYRKILLVLISLATLAMTSNLLHNCFPDCLYHVNGRTLVLSFLTGVLFYQYREMIPINPVLALSALGLACFFLSIGPLVNLAVMPLTYLVVYFGLMSPPKDNFFMRGDYSYGLYLFGAPVQQLFVWLMPDRLYWWFNLVTALPLAFACACLSWNFVESPILKRKEQIAAFITRSAIGSRAA